MRGYQSVKVNRLETNTTNTIKLNSIHYCNIKLKSRLAENTKESILNAILNSCLFVFPFRVEIQEEIDGTICIKLI